MRDDNSSISFEETFLPHLDAAHNLARWLTRDPSDAEDVVQEAYMRALRFFNGFHGGDGRSWILKIVRNTCYTWLQKNRPREVVYDVDLDLHEVGTSGPEEALIESLDRQLLTRLLSELPPAFREVVVLRDIEGMSYKEIAAVTEQPLGTVMSRLARARQKLQADAGTTPVGASR